MKTICILIACLTSFVSVRSQDLHLNEVCFKNRHILNDFDDDSPDWIEIYNSSEHAVNLSGFGLTDDTSKVSIWRFPVLEINPDSYIIVFASGKDTVVDGEIHTSFKLSGIKESLYLLDDENKVIDYINPSCVPADHSLCRIPDGSANLIAASCTPAATNNSAETLAVSFLSDTLIVDYKSGFYKKPFAVTLSNSHKENLIMYTLDGDDPDDRSSVYHEPLMMKDLTPGRNRFANIPETVVEPGNEIFKANILRAVVLSNGCPASNEINCTYFVNESIGERYDIPVVSLITDKDNLFDDKTGLYVHGKYRNFDQHGAKWERDVHVEILDEKGNLVIDQNAGMRIHGRGSRRAPQKSLRLYADKEYGKESFNYPFFSQKPWLDNFRVLLLRSTGYTLGSIFKEELCNSLVRNMNIDYMAGETAILFINGEYWGIYNLMERQNKYYVEGNYKLPDADLDIIAYDRYIAAQEGTLDEYNNLVNWLHNSDPTSEDFFRQANEKIDIGSLIDYYVAQLYFGNFDWPESNMELWKIRSDTSRWRYFFYDSDASMIWINSDKITEHTNDIDKLRENSEFSTIIPETLLKNSEFRTLFTASFFRHMNSTFRADHVIEAINSFEKKYSPLIPEHIYRWHNPVDYPKWEENVEWLRNFAIQRPLYIAEQLSRNFGGPLVIYPNPSAGDFAVKISSPVEKMTVTIFSTGGIVQEQWPFEHVSNQEVHIHSSLPQGAYIIQVTTNANIYCDKLFIR